VRTGDFPFRAADPHARLYWRIDRVGGLVAAVGVAEVLQPERIDEVRLDLRGLDRAGQIVTRTSRSVYSRSFAGTEPWSFDIALRASGEEDRFEVAVAGVTWKELHAGR
jgi:hypothetical protein